MHLNDSSARPRLLVISYHFPPDGSIGGLRWHGLSKYLARMGWEVHVVTAASRQGVTDDPGVHVHVCHPHWTLNDVYRGLKKRLSRQTMGSDPSHESRPTRVDVDARGPLEALRKNAADLLAFPDYGRGWIVPAARMARRLLSTHSFDGVVTSGPPHSAHIAGLLATLYRAEPHWLDMRDPWANLSTSMTTLSETIAPVTTRYLLPRVEKAVIGHAAHVICNTAASARELRAAYPRANVAHVPNGIDPETLPRIEDEPLDGLVLAHVGSLYAGRDLGPILSAMRQFLSTHPEARPRIRLLLAGGMDPPHAARLGRQVEEAGLSQQVVLLGMLPRDDALKMLGRSHLALVLAQGQPLQVPGKIYECVALQVPTLVLTEADSASASEARRLGVFAYDGKDLNPLTSLLERLWNGDLARPSKKTIQMVDYSALAETISSMFLSHSGASVAGTVAPITSPDNA
ncbi:MAG: glycosyltransferase [Dehalococcoidia bacterium]